MFLVPRQEFPVKQYVYLEKIPSIFILLKIKPMASMLDLCSCSENKKENTQQFFNGFLKIKLKDQNKSKIYDLFRAIF